VAHEDGGKVFVEFVYPSFESPARYRRNHQSPLLPSSLSSASFPPLSHLTLFPLISGLSLLHGLSLRERRYARRAIEDREIPITYYRGEESFSRSCRKMDFFSFLLFIFGIFISNLSLSRNLISSEIYLSEKRRVRWILRF